MALAGLVAAIFILVIGLTLALIRLPFEWLYEYIYTYPKRTARIVIGMLVAGGLSYLLNAPYVIEITFGGGAIAFLIGELF